MTTTFSSLKTPDFRSLWWAGTCSLMSIQMQFLLRGILSWDLTESEGALGLVYLALGVSMLIFTPIGGVASDRYSKRAVLLGSQSILVTSALIMGILVLTGREQFWMVLVSALAQGAGFGFFGPARLAFASELVEREQLGNAITLSTLSQSGSRIFALSLAGALASIEFVGVGGAFLVSGAFSLVGFVFLLRLPEGRRGGTAQRKNPFVEILDGVRYVGENPPLRRVVLSSVFVIMLAFNYVAFIPALVEGTFGLSEEWVGVMSSASAIGALAVFVPLATGADSPFAKTAMVISGIGFGLCVVALGLAPSFWPAFAAVVLIGAGSTAFQTLSNTLALAISNDEYQGRVQSIIQLSFAGFGIAAFPFGTLAEWIGLQETMVLMGTGAVTTVVVFYLADTRAMRRDSAPAAIADDTATV